MFRDLKFRTEAVSKDISNKFFIFIFSIFQLEIIIEFSIYFQEHLTRTFVMHYSRIPSVLEMSSDPDTLSNRVVHMSVQLFSNESLALKMVEELSLLHVMIISLKLMMSKILIPNSLHGKQHYDFCFFSHNLC